MNLIVFKLILLVLFTLSGCADGEGDVGLEPVDLASLDDEQLWNLLKEASRNGSDISDDTIFDYDDYVDLDETSYATVVNSTEEFLTSSDVTTNNVLDDTTFETDENSVTTEESVSSTKAAEFTTSDTTMSKINALSSTLDSGMLTDYIDVTDIVSSTLNGQISTLGTTHSLTEAGIETKSTNTTESLTEFNDVFSNATTITSTNSKEYLSSTYSSQAPETTTEYYTPHGLSSKPENIFTISEESSSDTFSSSDYTTEESTTPCVSTTPNKAYLTSEKSKSSQNMESNNPTSISGTKAEATSTKGYEPVSIFTSSSEYTADDLSNFTAPSFDTSSPTEESLIHETIDSAVSSYLTDATSHAILTNRSELPSSEMAPPSDYVTDGSNLRAEKSSTSAYDEGPSTLLKDDKTNVGTTLKEHPNHSISTSFYRGKEVSKTTVSVSFNTVGSILTKSIESLTTPSLISSNSTQSITHTITEIPYFSSTDQAKTDLNQEIDVSIPIPTLKDPELSYTTNNNTIKSNAYETISRHTTFTTPTVLTSTQQSHMVTNMTSMREKTSSIQPQKVGSNSIILPITRKEHSLQTTTSIPVLSTYKTDTTNASTASVVHDVVSTEHILAQGQDIYETKSLTEQSTIKSSTLNKYTRTNLLGSATSVPELPNGNNLTTSTSPHSKTTKQSDSTTEISILPTTAKETYKTTTPILFQTTRNNTYKTTLASPSSTSIKKPYKIASSPSRTKTPKRTYKTASTTLYSTTSKKTTQKSTSGDYVTKITMKNKITSKTPQGSSTTIKYRKLDGKIFSVTTSQPKKIYYTSATTVFKIFDPKRITVIDDDSEKEPVLENPFLSCKEGTCTILQRNQSKIFDSKKMFMIDEATEPTVILKNKFDPIRKFTIPDNDKNDAENKKTIATHSGKPQLIPNDTLKINPKPIMRPKIHVFFTPVSEEAPVSGPISTLDQQYNPQNHGQAYINQSIPRLVCVRVGDAQGRPKLRCLTLRPTPKPPQVQYAIKYQPRMLYQDVGLRSTPYRRVFIANPNFKHRQMPAYLINSRPPHQDQTMSYNYNIRGNIINTPSEGRDRRPIRFKVALNAPHNNLFVSNGPTQGYRKTLIRFGIGNNQKEMPLQPSSIVPESQPCCNQQDMQISNPQPQLKLALRNKRSIYSRCDPDNNDNEVGHTLAFVFDNTGSMHQELEQMRETAIGITTEMTEKKKGFIYDYVLVTFNDPGVAEPFCTTDYTAFLSSLQSITIGDGGDCPEYSLTGLLKALTVSRRNPFIFVITDADAKDYYLEEKILTLVMRKKPVIFYLTTDLCSTPSAPGFQVYRNISSSANGKVIQMGKEMGVKELLQELNERFVQENLVTFSTVTKHAAGKDKINVPIDPSTKELTFSVSGATPKLVVTDPKGDKPTGDSKKFPRLVIVTYKEPEPGVWIAEFGSSSPHSFSSVGISRTNFKIGYSIIPTNKFSETSHRPLKGGDNYILVEVTNPEAVEKIDYIHLVSSSGDSLQKIYLNKVNTSSNTTIYSGGPFVPPEDLFNIEMHGVSKSGVPIKRVSQSAISAQLPDLPYITMISHASFEAGKSFTLKCHVESLVPVIVKFYKRDGANKIFSYKFKQTGDAIYELMNVTLSDEGIYNCWAKNSAGDQVKQIDVTVLVEPPTITVEEKVLFIENQQVVLPCNVFSPVPYTVSWMKSENSKSSYIPNTLRIYTAANSLFINKAQKTDEGWYQCVAENKGGKTDRQTHLILSQLPVIDISPDKKFQQGFNVSITCSATGYPSPSVFWYKKQEKLPAGDYGRFIVQDSNKYGEIFIIKTLREDEGSYTCAAKNFAGEVRRKTNLIYQEKPKVYSPIRNAELKVGEMISLPCAASGIPLPDIHWIKDNLAISKIPNTMVLSDNSLQIKSSNLTHSGVYRCRAENEVGSNEISILVSVSGTKPEIIDPPEGIVVEVGGNGTLTCVASGIPQPIVSWSRSYDRNNILLQNETSFKLFNASLADQGEYLCIAENSLGKTFASAFVNVTGTMPILRKIKEIERIKVLVGAKVELGCQIIGGNPRPQIEWFKDGHKLPKYVKNRIQLENGSYFISFANSSDGGIYECIAVNGLGSDKKKIELKFYEPPKIDTSVSPNVVATIGTTARLTCKVSGDPSPKVSWRRQAHGRLELMKRDAKEDSTDLIINDVSEENTGKYKCLAENIAGNTARSFFLKVLVPPKISPWPVEMFVDSGNIFTLQCRVIKGIPRPNTMWLKDEQPLSRSEYYGQYLRFNVKPEDSGSYKCIAENSVGKHSVETSLVVLVAPQIKSGPSSIKVITGYDATLPCEVTGNPQPSISWKMNGELVKKELGSDSGALHLQNVTEADAGTYVCITQNKAGIYEKKLELIVLTPPKVVLLPSSDPLKVVVGEFVNVTCQNFADSKATINWFKDKQPLPPQYVIDENRIEFIVKPEHKGIYSCQAKNEAGSDMKEFLLMILDPPSFAPHLPFSFDVLKGKTIEIPCTAYGDPKPVIGWNITDVILESNSERIVNSESGTLTIINASLEDEGYYNCTARNKAGAIWRTIELSVQELPSANITVSNNIVKEGEQVEFTCHTKGKPKPKIHWKKDGLVLFTENKSRLRLVAYYKDHGNYTCVVKNSVGEDSSTVQLNVSVIPTIHGSSSESIIALEGENIVMNCSTGGVPRPHITWAFNSTYGKNPFKKVFNGPVMTLFNANKYHDGTYSCSAINFAGYAKKQFSVYVYVKPTITDNDEHDISILEGKDFILPCNVEGIPKPSITWYKGEKELSSISRIDNAPSVYKNLLVILSAHNGSEGNYTCLAKNKAGIATRNYTMTVKAHKTVFVGGNMDDVKMKHVEINEGTDGTLHCNSEDGANIVWLKDNKTISELFPERADEVHVEISNGGKNLKITEASTSDSGMYACIEIYPDKNITKMLFSVNILVPPYFLDLDIIPTNELTVKENESITLRCPAIGNPPPQINWRLADNNLPISQYTLPGVHINGDTLLIKSAQTSHSGLYLCSAVNRIWEEKRIFRIKVVGPPKRIGPDITEMVIVRGTELVLNCSINSCPDPVFKWTYKNSSGNEKDLKYFSKIIHIGNIQSEDDGLYTCIASNEFGDSNKTFNLSVIEAPQIKRSLKGTIQLAIGEDISLKCVCNGKKPMTVKWYFNERELNYSGSSMRVVNSSQLEYTYNIYNVTKESQGTYSCLLSNIAGSDHKEFQVEVIAPPKLAMTPKSEIIQVMAGTKIHLECPVESIDDFQIQWKKNGVIIPEVESLSMHINESAVNDEGNYTCIASNFAGKLASKFHVNVLVVPVLLDASGKDLYNKLPLDSKLTLNCSVFGKPKPHILWTKNLLPISSELLPQIIFSNDDQILEIYEVDSSDSGKYSCFPSNAAGSTEKHFDVEVTVPPLVEGKNDTHEKTVMVDVYRRAVLRCPLIGSPEPKITWKNGSSNLDIESNSKYRISLDGKILTINHADEFAAGIYSCSGENQAGRNTIIFYLHIRIPMQWSSWGNWLECNVSCGGGVQIRQRDCLGERNNILSEYVHLYNSSCTGLQIETRECNNHVCPIDGGWGSWSDWGSCSSSCGNGWRRRSRRCNNPTPSNGGEDCYGETYEDEKCEGPPCPLDGGWSEWSDWNACSATCGPSIKMRTRRCNNPIPAYGGQQCHGNSRDIELCTNRDCPNDGSWSSWSRWSACSVSCGMGRKVRTRKCLMPHGRYCKGETFQIRPCRRPHCPRRRYARHVMLRIHGELNNHQIDQNIEAELVQNNNETSIAAISKNVSHSGTLSYMPFIMSPVSWYTASEDEGGKNGLSLTNGTFQENSTYHFSTGEKMEVQSDAESAFDPYSDESLKLDVKVTGSVPPVPAATIVIKPYTEEIIQTDANYIKTSSSTDLDIDGSFIPVTWNKNVSFSGNEGSRIYPVESLSSKGSRSYFNKKRQQLEFRANPSMISSRFLRNSCPPGFKYDLETGECSDINECRRRGLNDCLPSQICINSLGSYSCECRQGFTKHPSNAGCKDINECTEGMHQCSHRCQNTRGSYQCLCPKHLILSEDMHNCVEISDYDYYDNENENYHMDYWTLDSKPAGSNQNLSYRGGKSLFLSNTKSIQSGQISEETSLVQQVLPMESSDKELICEEGFQKGEFACEDINECSEDDNACTKEQLCLNTPGSYICIETPCPEKFILSPETRSCLVLCLEEKDACTDGAVLSESLQIITVPVYNGNYTFQPFTNILEMVSYDNNDLPLSGCIYTIVQNESGVPVKIRNEKRIGILYTAKYFEVTKKERLILMSSKYDSNGNKLHSTMFLVIIYNINTSLV